MRKRSSIKPRKETDKITKALIDLVTGNPIADDYSPVTKGKDPVKNPAAVILGRLGGRKGGPARAAKLSSKRKREIARKAARARWAKPEADK